MAYIPKKQESKVTSSYKTLYLRQSLIDAVEQIAINNDMSFNSVVISMIEDCLSRGEADE